MKVVGEVTFIVHEGRNGYKVFEIKDEKGKRTKVAGECAPIKPHTVVEVYGEFRTYGRGKTLYIKSMKLQNPTTEDETINFLSSGLIKGVGDITARRIYEKFGADTLKVLSNPMELTQVKGVTIEKAKKISDSYKAVVHLQNVYMYLGQYGISNKMIQKIYDRYGQHTISVVQQNPYKLIEEIRGIGFLKADEMALKIGIPWDSDFRIASGIKYVLESQAKAESHTYLPKAILKESLAKLLGASEESDADATMNIDKEKVEKCLADLIIEGQIFYFPTYPGQPYMLRENYFIEKTIAKNLRKLIDSQPKIEVDIEFMIRRFEKENNITLHENQKKAVQTAIESGICIITGGPGVGKTTIIKCIISILQNLKARIALAAPTGRAAKRMEEATGMPAKTIHRMLEYKGGEGDGGYFSRDESNRLEEDTFIIDEMSMTDENIFNALLKAIMPGSRLILVGDKDQLQSVGTGNVLGDLIESNEIDIAYLTHIYRQSGGNKIAENAQLINNNKMPNLNNEKGSRFNFLNIANSTEIIQTVKSLMFDKIPKATGIEPQDIQVMCPVKGGEVGVENLNFEIRKKFIEMSDDIFINEIKTANGLFRVGDKVMQTTNRYNATILNAQELNLQDEGVYNGDVGYVIGIEREARIMKVEFADKKIVLYKDEELNDLILAYAITIHKSQGSEFPIAIIVLQSQFNLTKSLLYTAVTRAKRSVVIISTKQIITHAVGTNGEKERYTFLKEFLTGEVI